MKNDKVVLSNIIRKTLISTTSSATCIILLNLSDNKPIQNIFKENNIKFFLLIFSIQIIVFYGKNIFKFIKNNILRTNK